MYSFYRNVKEMVGRDYLNIYALLIVQLQKLDSDSLLDKSVSHGIIKEVKKLFENHEANLAPLIFILRQNLSQHGKRLSYRLNSFLLDVVSSIEETDLQEYYKISPSDITVNSNNCEIARRFESETAIQMLRNPTPGMLRVTNKISKKIILALESGIDEGLLNCFLIGLGPDKHDEPYYAFAFGRFSKTPTVEMVIDALNESSDLSKVMLIQFLFMRNILSRLDLSGYLDEKVEQIDFDGDLAAYFERNLPKTANNLSLFFCQYPQYAPHLYTDRGRKKFCSQETRRMGIMLKQQDKEGLPEVGSSWYPDCLSNVVDLNSPYVKKIICETGIPYVSGPSGMTSILLGLYVLFGNILNRNETNDYIISIMSFIVGGGLHNIHEVLTIPTVRLGLYPKYIAFGKGAGNYETFFQLFGDDNQFKYNMNQTWKKLTAFIDSKYSHLTDCTVSDKLGESDVVLYAKQSQSSTGCILL